MAWSRQRHLALIPRYKDLYEKRKAAPGGKKGHNGGLEQHIYLSQAITLFFNRSGVLGNNQLPIDRVAGDLGICTRALFTSAMVAYAEQHNLKHPTEKKYIMPDQALQMLITPQASRPSRHPSPKSRRSARRVLSPRRTTQGSHSRARWTASSFTFSFDAIPTICNLFIVPLPPRAIDAAQKEQLAGVRAYLHT